MIECGMKENRITKALCSYEVDRDVKLILGTHVDDVLWACKPEAQHIIDKLKSKFKFGKIETGEFRYCGKEKIIRRLFNQGYM